MENPVLPVLPEEIFLLDDWTATIRVLINPPLFLAVTDQGPADFSMALSSTEPQDRDAWRAGVQVFSVA